MGGTTKVTGLAVVAMLGLGCGGDDSAETDAETMSGDTEDSTGSTDPTSEGESSDGSTGGGEEEGEATTGECTPAATPERFIVFGDSILACSTESGGKTAPGCSARLVHEHVESIAPGVTYENAAVGGAVTTDVPGQMAGVDATLPGHAVVVIGIGGNDLSGFLLTPDQTAMDQFDELSERLDDAWDEMFAWLLDDAHFPDGFTLVVDNQYNPFDDCTADPYSFMTPLKTELLGVFNDRVAERLEAHANAHLSDIYGAFLGHGHHWNTAGCPHTKDGADYWMIGGTDLIHPSTAGHASIAVEIQAVIDDVYACE